MNWRVILCWVLGAGLAQVELRAQSNAPPVLPPELTIASYSFADTNWLSDAGEPPLAETNLVSVPKWDGNALLLDTTNEIPAYLAYNIVETNGATNLEFDAGAVEFVFINDWASADTNQNGAGPGTKGFLLAAGDFSTNSPEGLWGIYFDPSGTNLCFGGVSNGISTVFARAPISWASNSIHLIGISYSSNTEIYVDGRLAGSGGPVTVIPSANTWSNGFYIGSDAGGFEQARGIFWHVELDDAAWFYYHDGSYFTNTWVNLSNIYANWQNNGGGGLNPDSTGSLLPGGGGGDCVTGTNVYLTNLSSAIVPGVGNTFTFTIAGGQPGSNYDVFATTNLSSPIEDSGWTWLGQGTNCGVYSVASQPGTWCFYLLGNSQLAGDGSGLTVAYEQLIGTSSDGFGTPNLWYVLHGLSPALFGAPNGAADSDNDGLSNYQEYLRGTDPNVSEGFSIFVAEPDVTSGIP